MRTDIHSPEELEALPDDSIILDSGMEAVKRKSAWDYGPQNGGFWEPERFPVELKRLGSGE